MIRPTAIFALLVGLGATVLAAPALGEVQGPGLEVSAETFPTNIAPSGEGLIILSVLNGGAANTSGTITVTDVLPPGLTAVDAGSVEHEGILNLGNEPELWDCSGTTVVQCRNDPVNLPWLTGGGGAPYLNPSSTISPADPQIAIAVRATGTSGVLLNRVTAAGGGAPSAASVTQSITVSETPASFGLGMLDAWFTNSDGSVDTQAGSHPYSATFAFGFDQTGSIVQEGGSYDVSALQASEQVRTVEIDLPPGLIGDPQAVPQCSRELFENASVGCPADTQIGFASTTFGEIPYTTKAVFNLVPRAGRPAAFGFNVAGTPTNTDASVRTGSDYGIRAETSNIPERNVQNAFVTLWSNPGDASHAPWNAALEPPGCVTAECFHELPSAKPFLTLPTACGSPPKFTARIHPWFKEQITEQATFEMHDANHNPVGVTGCEHLTFAPAVTTAPDTSRADSPAGLTVDVKPPVGGLSAQEGLSSADIQDTTVTLPPGVAINPGQAAGLQSCPAGRPDPAEGRYGDALTTEAEKEQGEEDDDAAYCPGAAKVATLTIKSPLIESAPDKQFEGNVYVLQSNPPEVKLLIAASADGVNLKLVGTVHLCESTDETVGAKTCESVGQLITTFANTPELPFTDFKLSFSGGAQAALATPTQCGTYISSSEFVSWSDMPGSDYDFLPEAFPTAEFALTEGPGGGPCPSSPLPFSPTMTAGSTTDQAGGFTDFSLLLQRGDGQQRMEALQFKEPAGLAGLISSVPLCPEPQAAQGTCSPASHIGHAAVASGPGPFPLVLPQPGAPELPIYLTGPYKGAPFGLSIVTPVIAGPFDLGTIVTRAKIEVDPHTAQITITTDSLPQVVKGVPTDLRSINAIIDRPGFLFNPTSCTPADFTGTATSAGGAANAPLSSHFGIGSCRELGFHPKLEVTTASKSSKADGSSLAFRISYPKGALGTESWFNEAKFDLPKQLPARLTTIQKACLASVFEANPAACPAASLIGHATVHTPVLPVPLVGPVYFVSHGGAKFPDAAIILQGDGVTVDLTGETFINGKTGITSATFRNTPDVPFEDIEVTIPAGPFSEFGVNLPTSAHGSFCGQKLVVPTFFKAQNGLEINQSTRIGVTGCSTKLAIASHKLKGHNLTVSVFAPGAGRLKVSAKGLSTVSQSATGVETLKFTLHIKRRGKFKTRLKVMFTPSKGKRQTRAVSVVA